MLACTAASSLGVCVFVLLLFALKMQVAGVPIFSSITDVLASDNNDAMSTNRNATTTNKT